MQTLNKAAWLNQHSLIHFSDSWAPGTQLVICAQSTTAGKKRFFTAGYAPVNDAEAAWAVIEREAAKGNETWISLAGLQENVIATRKRGTRENINGIPALFADLDFEGADHKAQGNPSPVEADGWVEAFTEQIGTPTLVNHSGGGLHLLIALDEILTQDDPAHVDLTLRWKQWWMRLAADADRNIDSMVLADFARIYRPAGSWNAKQARTVTTVSSSDRRYSVSELIELLPEVEAPVRKKTATKVTSQAVARVFQPGETDERPGTRFAYSFPVSRFLEAVLDLDIDGSVLTWPRPDGSIPDAPNCRIYEETADAPEKVSIFSTSVSAPLGIPENNSLSSFELMTAIFFGGDFKASAKFLANTFVDGEWSDELAARLRTAYAGGELNVDKITVAPPVVGDEVSNTSDAPYEGFAELDAFAASMVAPVRTVADAIANRTKASVELGDDLVVMINTDTSDDDRRHGLYRRRSVETVDENSNKKVSKVVLDQITDWVAWRSKATSSNIVDEGSMALEVDASHTVQIIKSNGATRARAGFSSSESVSPKTIVDALDAGVSLPVDTKDRNRVESMLRTLGYDEREDLSSYGTTGWLLDLDTDKHVYLAPAGSVTAEGIDRSYVVVEPPKSEVGSMGAAAMGIGYRTLPSNTAELRAAAESVKAFFRIVPQKPELAAALIGNVFCAPLALTSRGSTFMVAPPQSAKSELAGCLQRFISLVSGGGQFTGGALLLDTPFATSVKTAWGRNTTLFFDDFKFNGESIERATKNVGIAVNAAYGTDGGAGGNRDGGLRSTTQGSPACVLTGEGMPKGEGFVSRLIKIEISLTDVVRSPANNNPLDVFKSQFAAKANQLHGAYVQWLARRVDEVGIAEFTRENDAAKLDWMAGHVTSRAAQNVASLGVAWEALYAFAAEGGFLDVLPARDVVMPLLAKLVTDNTESLKESNQALRVIQAVRDAVASRAGYIDIPSNDSPRTEVARALGWTPVTFNGVTEFKRQGACLGILSDDATQVAITNEAINRMKTQLDLRGLPSDQLLREAKAHVAPGTRAGDKASTKTFATRPRGWIVSTEQLDIEWPEA